jgi:2-dehydro-3-deoxy-L-rhamnonate dehydrogenase (NAD+)
MQGIVEHSVMGQVAIVTGAGQGIGRAITLRLAKDGMDIVIADRQADRAEEVAGEVRAAGRRALALSSDVTLADDRRRMLDTTLTTFGRLDVLVNNAAINRAALPGDVTEEHWDTLMNVNAKAVYFCSQLVLEHMKKQRSGRIVNIASIAGKLASTIYHPIYNVSKAAVIAMTKTLALAHAADGIRVNAVGPGFIRTPLVEASLTPEVMTFLESQHALGRMGTAEEVAELVAWLASDGASFATGAYYPIDGGYLAR